MPFQTVADQLAVLQKKAAFADAVVELMGEHGIGRRAKRKVKKTKKRKARKALGAVVAPTPAPENSHYIGKSPKRVPPRAPLTDAEELEEAEV